MTTPNNPALNGFNFSVKMSTYANELYHAGQSATAGNKDKALGELGGRGVAILTAFGAVVDAISYLALSLVTAACANEYTGKAFDFVATKGGMDITHTDLNYADAAALLKKAATLAVCAVALPVFGLISPENAIKLLSGLGFAKVAEKTNLNQKEGSGEEQTSKLEASNKDLEVKLIDTQNSIENLKSELSDAQNTIKNLESEIEEKNTSLGILERFKEDHKKIIKERNASIQDLQAQLEKKTEEANAIEALSEELKSVQRKNGELQTEKQNLETLNTELMAKATELKDTIQLLKQTQMTIDEDQSEPVSSDLVNNNEAEKGSEENLEVKTETETSSSSPESNNEV
jgi:DNA repair exonuclease SbcCD ATPase subunit